MNTILKKLNIKEINSGACVGAEEYLNTQNNGQIDSCNPTTGEVIAKVNLCSEEDYDYIIKRSDKVFQSWRMLPAPKRGEIVRLMAIALRENKLEAFRAKITPVMGHSFKEKEIADIIKLKNEDFEETIKKRFSEFRKERNMAINEQTNLELEKRIFLQTIDFLWRSHLQYLEHLRQAVGLRGYAQKDPLEEFKREAFKLFESLLNRIKIDFITF